MDHVSAAERTDALRAAGADEVLWLTRACTWVEQLPALGITSFDPTVADYRAHTGFLEFRPGKGLRVTEVSVRDVLRRWVADELAWAYRDRKKAGWATVTDWQQHTKRQADIIQGLGTKLAAAERTRDYYKTVIDNQRQRLEQNQNQIEQDGQVIRQQKRQLDTAATENTQAATSLTAARAEITHTKQQLERERKQHREAHGPAARAHHHNISGRSASLHHPPAPALCSRRKYMQRNLYGALCRECGCGVGQREGGIYDSGRSNTVVCLSCLHDWYGESLDVRVTAWLSNFVHVARNCVAHWGECNP